MSPFPIKKDPLFFYPLFLYTIFIHISLSTITFSLYFSKFNLSTVYQILYFIHLLNSQTRAFVFLIRSCWIIPLIWFVWVDHWFLTHTYLISFLLIPRYIYASISHIHIPSSSYNSLHLHLLPSSPPFSFCLFIRFHIHIQAFKIHFSPPHLFFCLCKLALI